MKINRLTIIAFVAGMLITSASTATATKLITGRQIKNGSIELKDLSKSARAALRGQVGPTGPAGPEGPFPSASVPSGKTIRGNYALGAYAPGLSYGSDSISFGFRFSSPPQPHMIEEGGWPPVECPGSVTNPQAEPGHLCVYEGLGFRGTGINNAPRIFNPETAEYDLTNRWGAGVSIRTESGGASSTGTWAATAP